jgi:hypothetical protein
MHKFLLTQIDLMDILSSRKERHMAYQRLSKEKQTLVLMALCEGVPIRAATRMFKVGKDTIHRLICETGEAFADYMDRNFRDLPCLRSRWMSSGNTSVVMLAGCRNARKHAAAFGFGRASTRTQN